MSFSCNIDTRTKIETWYLQSYNSHYALKKDQMTFLYLSFLNWNSPQRFLLNGYSSHPNPNMRTFSFLQTKARLHIGNLKTLFLHRKIKIACTKNSTKIYVTYFRPCIIPSINDARFISKFSRFPFLCTITYLFLCFFPFFERSTFSGHLKSGCRFFISLSYCLYVHELGT